MDRNITHYNSMKEIKKEAISTTKTMFGPRESTLDFLRQFARVYHCEPNLEPALSSFITN